MNSPPKPPSIPQPPPGQDPRSSDDPPATGGGAAASLATGPGLDAVLGENLASVRAKITTAADHHGGPEPKLIAVTKSVPPNVAMALHRLGCGDLAENRAPAFLDKVQAFRAAGLQPTWHFIGHVQRNKARRILEHADVLHSVDSVRLAETITRLLGELKRPISVFLEINLTGESEKHGLVHDEWKDALAALAKSPFARVLGLMVMGPLEARGSQSTDQVFAAAHALAKDIQRTHGDLLEGGNCRLSMGMSGDLDPAIRHGSTDVRVGSSLFQSIPSPLPTDRIPGAPTTGPSSEPAAPSQ